MEDFLSTTEAAKYLRVTRLTVISWADKGIIPTHKTPGGHRRISKGDLFIFMKEHGMNPSGTDLSMPDVKFSPCWEYHKDEKWKNHKCRGCLVFLTNAKKCYMLREKVGHKRIFCKFNCQSCTYYKDYHNYFQWCWEFHQEKGSKEHNCSECVVFQSGIKKCYILREETDHKKIFCKSNCHDCDYYKKTGKKEAS
ncbi:MAG: helix-turn-helix domain-containing protein [Candidatus Omnitrophica bacterium]|nr:helix-turn-helix domain-containing protein [Candidatus Omnitrophota bacterium]